MSLPLARSGLPAEACLLQREGFDAQALVFPDEDLRYLVRNIIPVATGFVCKDEFVSAFRLYVKWYETSALAKLYPPQNGASHLCDKCAAYL